jgi:N-acetylglutamate synthase-like GNAT family acetyltransferase
MKFVKATVQDIKITTMYIIYKGNITPTTEQVITLYNNAGLPRPTNDAERIKRMYDNSNIIITAWDGDIQIGVSRCITDWCWCCYLADLDVQPVYQKEGIGKKLIELTKTKAGEQCMILLFSVSDAFAYYPKVGFTKEDRAFAIDRTK